MTTIRHRRRSIAVVLTILVTGAGATTPAGAASSPKQRLRDAASGIWVSELGTLDFGIGEAVTFTIKVCGHSPLRPGFVTVGTDCEPDVVTGDLRVRAGRYVVAAADGGAYNFGAYLDGEVLHVGPGGAVAKLDADRTGTVDLGGGSRLVVGDGACRFTSSSEDFEDDCRFVERQDRTILEYRWPDPFRGGKVTRAGLVYLDADRLLVSPELVEYTFTREETAT